MLVRDSKLEIQDIHQKMIEYEKTLNRLELVLNEHEANISRRKQSLEELKDRESLVSQTLKTLEIRRDKVKLIWTGISTNLP